MPSFIDMPSLSDTMTEGTLLKWRIKPGDRIQSGQIIADIQTDKATMEMEAFDDGIVHKLYLNEGDKVPLGAPMAMMLEEGESPPADDSPPRRQSSAADERGGEAVGRSAGPHPVGGRAPRPGAGVGVRTSSGRVKASPLARKLAADRGINLATLVGTGPGGRIVKVDVLDARARDGGGGGGGLPVIRPKAGPDDVREPLTPMRQIIAQRLLVSKTQIPHFYLHIEIDAAPLTALRTQANAAEEQKGSGHKFTINDFILKAVAAAAAQVPAVNAAFDGDAIVRFGHINVSVAIALDDGLVTPVIRDADRMSLTELSLAVRDLARRAREMKLRPEEFQDGTITVSNLGAYGIDQFDAIINPPQAVIVSVGAVVKKPVVAPDGTVAAGERLNLGLSGDHRVVDGAVGARFLQALRTLLENPALMLV